MLFKILAITVLVAFYGCYFIKMIGQHKKGIQTNQMGKGKVGFTKFVETALKIATLVVPVAEIVSIILDTAAFPTPVRIAGAVIAAGGVTIFITAVVQMRDSWRAGVPEKDKTELVTGGIFKISRNPAFLGFDLVYTGILLMFFNWVLFAASLLAAAMIHLQIVNVEEDFLFKAFGEDYLNYKKQVNRYLGRR